MNTKTQISNMVKRQGLWATIKFMQKLGMDLADTLSMIVGDHRASALVLKYGV